MTTTPARPIIVGVGDAGAARPVLAWATREAALRGTSLVLVHAAGSELALEAPRTGADLAPALDDALVRAQGVLAEAASIAHALDPGVAVETRLSLDASESALRRPSERPSLVVVGARTGSRSPSTLDALEPRVGHGLDCPLIEVGRAGAATELVVLADGTAWSVPVLTAAFEEAQLRGLSVTVAHVLEDPFPEDPAQDLPLIDQTARIEAAAGPSDLGFRRTLLDVQVRVMRDRFPTVPVRLVDLDEEVDRLLAAAASTTTYLITDSAHLRRLHDVSGPSGGDRWITVVVPSSRPQHRPEVRDPGPVVPATHGTEPDLEAWWDAPTVDEPRAPVRVRVRRHLRHLRP